MEVEQKNTRLVSTATGQLSITHTTIPEPDNNEILIKIVASGVCHTDVHQIDRDWERAPATQCFGHEGVGEIVKMGVNVEGLTLGERVGMSWLGTACGRCELCIRGKENYCTCQKNHGFTIDGAFQDYVVVNAMYCTKIPDQLSSVQAAPLLCAGVTAYKALRESGAKSGDWVLITGAAGGLGHLGVQYAKASGMLVIAVDIGAEKLSFCQGLGADMTIDPTTLTEAEILQLICEKTDSQGCAAALCLAPNVQSVEMAIHSLRPCGTAVLVAFPKGNISLSPFEIITKGIKLVGSLVGTRADMKEALEFGARGEVVCKTHVEPMKNYASVITGLRNGDYQGRVVFQDVPFSIN